MGVAVLGGDSDVSGCFVADVGALFDAVFVDAGGVGVVACVLSS